MPAGITYEQVVEACERLIQSGQNPSIRMVRRELGNTGSETTIMKHINEWRKSATPGEFVSVDLPPEFSTAVNKVVEQRIGEYRRTKEQELQVLRDDNTELTRLAEERDGQIAAKDAEVETLQIRVNTLEKELVAANAEKTVLRESASIKSEFVGFRQDLMAELAVRTEQAARIAELETQVAKLQGDLALERERHAEKSEEVEKYRTLIEMAEISKLPPDDPRLIGESTKSEPTAATPETPADVSTSEGSPEAPSTDRVKRPRTNVKAQKDTKDQAPVENVPKEGKKRTQKKKEA